MIVTMFPEPREQAKAIGVYGFVASAGGSIGLLAGGALTEAINWHWIFFINLPVGIATALLAVRLIDGPARASASSEGADVPGAVLLTGGLMLGVYTILEVAEQRLGLGPDARARRRLGRAAGRVRRAPGADREPADAAAAVPLAQRRRARTLVQALLVVGMFGMFFLGALYLQQILGYDALEVGLAFLPSTIVMGTMSLRFSGPLNMRFGPRRR